MTDWLAEVYVQHVGSLVRTAAYLLRNSAEAEDVVQDAYVKVAAARPQLRDHAHAHAYLRQTVVNEARSRLRRLQLARRVAPRVAVADEHRDAYALFDRDPIVQALRRLGARTREAVVLRYYADLSIDDTAAAMGVSPGAVKAYCSRGLAELNALMGDRT